MGGLQLLPGEKEELRLHPAASTFLARKLWAIAFLLWGGLLWTAFHSPWWVDHTPSDWTAAWTWLWGTSEAAYLWTFASLAAGGALASLPRGPWNKLWVGVGAGAIACLAAATWESASPEDTLSIVTMCAAIPCLAWLELRRLSIQYHITNLRLVVRTSLPRRTERSILYSDLVDLDARASPFPDTGTLIPVQAKPSAVAPPSAGRPQPFVLPGVRPLKRVRSLVEALARRATVPEHPVTAQDLEKQVAEALAALHRQ